ncbi:MAG: M36 family metallopeptidase, partial [Acidobacteriota bacterium]
VLIIAGTLFLSRSSTNAQRERGGKSQRGKATDHSTHLQNYDVRTDDSEVGETVRQAARALAGRSSLDVSALIDRSVEAEKKLRSKFSDLSLDRDPSTGIVGSIGSDVERTADIFLTAPARLPRSSILREFVTQNLNLFGLTVSGASDLKVKSGYSNPDGVLSFATLKQSVNRITVFQGEIKAGFTKDGRMFRVINGIAPVGDGAAVATAFGNAFDAVGLAAAKTEYEFRSDELLIDEKRSTGLKTFFGEGDWATTAEKVYFAVEPGTLVPAWQVVIWQPAGAYCVVVDTATGHMLWRKDLTEEQTQASVYSVYSNPSAMIDVADSPAPLSPGPFNAVSGIQGGAIGRSTYTIVGNEPPFAFNDLGWMTDGGNTTDGNAVESGLDLGGADSIDAGTQAAGVPARTFTSGWNPPPGNPPPASSPNAVESRRGAVIQQFWIMNRYHDELYRLGFTEAAGNFQNNNFGRGGAGSDRISAEGQDSSGTNNANFSTPPDGGRGKMQMYVWNGPTPDRDGTADAEIMIHEVTHGTSNRLHGDGLGLSTNMSRGLGEGWGDFYAHSLLSEPSDPIDGVYALGGYSLMNGFGTVGTQNYYYGIRRFPKAVLSSVGTNGKPYNPLTFADIDSTKADTTDGAFPAMTGSHISGQPDQVHAAGEVWSSALWEVRARFIERLGWEVGNRRILQFVTDGMKLAPINPTFLSERDAIIAAAQASGTPDDVFDIWAGFAVRGIGVGASIQNAGTGSGNTRVTESFDPKNAVFSDPLTVNDSIGDGDGYPEPGEHVRLNIPVKNTTGASVSNVQASVAGSSFVNYGNLADGATAANTIDIMIPADAVCGSFFQVPITVRSAIGTNPVIVKSIRLGNTTISSSSQNFDSVTAPSLPSLWSQTSLSGGSISWATSISSPNSGPNSAFANDPAGVNDAVLSTTIFVSSASPQLAFANRYLTESGFDGSVLEYSLDNQTWTDICPSCSSVCPGAGCPFVSGGYNQSISTGFGSPIGGRRAWSGNSGGYLTTAVNLPASLANKVVALRWRMASDQSVNGTGVWVDDIQLTGAGFLSGFTCSFAPTAAAVSVGGRVLTSGRLGISGARVTLTRSDGETISALTNAFGYYSFDDLEAGSTVTLEVTHRRYRFGQSSRVVFAGESVSSADFTALP